MASGFKSELTGLFSIPCDDNPTVTMVEAAYRHVGLNWRYINAEVPPDGLAAAIAGARAMGWRGFHLSMPHKVAVIRHLDGLGESARLINAVNCVVCRDGKLIGENTDGKGFLSSLVPVRDPRGARVMLLGAGGAARAIAVELVLAGVSRLSIINRSAARVPVATETLRPGLVVADVIPNPPRTQLLAAAEAAGCVTIDGLGMLVGQGILGIKYWAGIDADAGVMRAALQEAFS